ncbi:MAG: protein phosphatase 2C domain-containing protein [Burkholderiales bacterium]
MPPPLLDVAGVTDAGSVRQYNEDTIAYDAVTGVMALADGMGGHRAGEVASRMTIDVVVGDLVAALSTLAPDADPDALADAVSGCMIRANAAVYAAAQASPVHYGMGTTLALAVFRGDRVVLAHVGDSRIYRLRFNRLQLLTRDDSLLRDQIDLGYIAAAEAVGTHNRNLVTRAVGIATDIAPHVRDEAALPGDVFLLCSDGLNDLVDDADIELVLQSVRANVPLAAQLLVQAAKDNGGLDNVSVIVVRVDDPVVNPVRLPWWRRALAWLR